MSTEYVPVSSLKVCTICRYIIKMARAATVAAGFATAAAAAGCADAAWFALAVPRMYAPQFSRVTGREWRFRASGLTIAAAAFAYACVAGAATLAAHDALAANRGAGAAAWRGAVFGLLIYGCYNGTALAVFGEPWGAVPALVDTLWGCALSAAAAAAAWAAMSAASAAFVPRISKGA